MFILPAYFGQFSISVDTLEKLRLQPDGNKIVTSGIARAYLPREVCLINSLSSSVFVINQDIYKNDINRGFKLLKVETNEQDKYCNKPLKERVITNSN
jgi:hypothetical protein